MITSILSLGLGLAAGLAVFFFLPTYYRYEKTAAFDQARARQFEAVIKGKKPFCGLFFLGSVFLFYFFMGDNLGLFIFVFLFACAAYIDSVYRWVPDALVYGAAWVALSSMAVQEDPAFFFERLERAVIAVALMLAINVILWCEKSPMAYGAGDVYLMSSVSVWINQNHLLFYLLGAQLMAGLFAKGKAVAFVPFLYIGFWVYHFSRVFLDRG